MTRNEICLAAARKINAIADGATMSDRHMQSFAQALNGMVKRWHAKGMRVWTVSEGILFPAVAQQRYSVGTSGAGHITAAYDQTALSADEALGQTVLSVDSTTDFTVADNIGVTLDDGTLQWSTLSSKTATTLTIADTLTDSAAEDAVIYGYTSKIVRPLRIIEPARLLDVASGTESMIGVVPRESYFTIPNKAMEGDINQIYYDPQLSLAYIYVWPVPTSISKIVKFTWWRPIEDFDAAGDNPDLPQEWIDTLIFNLAVVMAPEYDVGTEKFAQIKLLADEYLDDLTGWDREADSIQFAPDTHAGG